MIRLRLISHPPLPTVLFNCFFHISNLKESQRGGAIFPQNFQYYRKKTIFQFSFTIYIYKKILFLEYFFSNFILEINRKELKLRKENDSMSSLMRQNRAFILFSFFSSWYFTFSPCDNFNESINIQVTQEQTASKLHPDFLWPRPRTRR